LADSLATRAHLNLLESSARLFALDPGAVLEAGDDWLLGAGSSEHPTIANAAFRRDDGADPMELISRAREFFGGMGRGFALWARAGLDEDADLIAVAESAGLEAVYEMPEMVLAGRAEEPPPAEGVEVRRLGSREEADHYWRIAASSYESVGFPPEVFGFYEGLERLPPEDSAAFLGYLDGEPVSIAMTLLSHGVAGIYWVGSLAEARGRGIGRAVTAAATNAGLELGADLASLQASHMGRPVYEAMGYEAIYDYRLFHSPAP
jgi:ribosomal protein S18 acetylase RimI-like enzyme